MNRKRFHRIISRCASDTKEFGSRLGKKLRLGDVVLLSGDLGAGKTTLVQGLAKGLGVKETALSPTFIIAQTYMGKFPIHHLDFYRLNAKEILAAGVQDYLVGGGEIPKGLVLIEWPERAKGLWPRERLEISIRINPDSENREIVVMPHGDRFGNLSIR